MRKITIMLIVLMVIVIGFLSGCSTNSEENKLKITYMEKSVQETAEAILFNITLKIQNIGSNDITGAELTVTLYKINSMEDSQIKQLGNIEKGWEQTTNISLVDNDINVYGDYRAVATITLGSKVLDTKTLSWGDD